MSALTQALAALDGAHIPGGCDHCDAIQSVAIIGPRTTAITIAHDDWCPTLAATGP